MTPTPDLSARMPTHPHPPPIDAPPPSPAHPYVCALLPPYLQPARPLSLNTPSPSLPLIQDAVLSILTMFVTPKRDLDAHTRVLQNKRSLSTNTPITPGSGGARLRLGGTGSMTHTPTPGAGRGASPAAPVMHTPPWALLTPVSASRPAGVPLTPLPLRPTSPSAASPASTCTPASAARGTEAAAAGRGGAAAARKADDQGIR